MDEAIERFEAYQTRPRIGAGLVSIERRVEKERTDRGAGRLCVKLKNSARS